MCDISRMYDLYKRCALITPLTSESPKIPTTTHLPITRSSAEIKHAEKEFVTSEWKSVEHKMPLIGQNGTNCFKINPRIAIHLRNRSRNGRFTSVRHNCTLKF